MTDAPQLERVIEALLYLSPAPVSVTELVEATDATEAQVERALDGLSGSFAEGNRGLMLKNVAGGWTLATDPVAADAARKLLSKPKTPPLTQAQAETLAIVAYLQPVSRPEISRIRGVAGESAVITLTERGLIEESGPLPLRRVDLPHDRALRARLRPSRPRRPARPRRLRPDARGRGRAARPPAQSGRGPRRPAGLGPSAPSRRSGPGPSGSPWSRPRRACRRRADPACRSGLRALSASQASAGRRFTPSHATSATPAEPWPSSNSGRSTKRSTSSAATRRRPTITRQVVATVARCALPSTSPTRASPRAAAPRR